MTTRKFTEKHAYDRMKFTEKHLPEGTKIFVTYDRTRRWDTRCELRSIASEKVLAVGESRCSDLDNPSRKIGRAIAVGRALKNYFGGREV